ncbi:hypothetical protein WJX73_008509 [Symbiochloris irregularis]|uniref:NADP-dependent oxidoreductase domain-containing protein n=1 Tax=Symbiochloris irregularis TaxID=706552 RepID=A0AAW1NYN9_9CHLO
MSNDYKTVEPQITYKLNNGLEIPAFGLGTWKSKPGQVEEAVTVALKAGYRHIDCAEAYGNHAEVGKAFAKVFSEGKVKRKDVWITSKLNNDKHDPAGVQKTCKQTLSDLQLDYLDLYLMHWPLVAGQKGPKVDPPVKDTWQAMEKLVDEGLVKSIGISNFSVPKTKELQSYARIKPVVNQVEIHPFWRNDKLWEYAQSSKSIHLTAYSPLASPDSAEAMGNTEQPSLLEDPTVVEIAKKLGKSPGQVLVRYAIQHGTSVIPKSVTPSRIQSNIEVLKFELPEEDYKKLNSLKFQRRYLDGASVAGFNPVGPYKNADELWDGEVPAEQSGK